MRRFTAPLLFACAALFSAPLQAQVSPSADYEVRFESTWSDTSHSVPLPPFAHYSPLIGSTHDDMLHLWQPGGIATPGIESMAETGATATLASEIDAAILAGSAGTRLNGPTLFTPGSTTMDLTATLTHPQLTLVTMIAPSPDWFVGIDGLDLLENGHWIESVAVDLYAWDSGTDSGTMFTSANSDTNPQDPIQLITTGPFFGTTPLGRFVITRKSVVTFCYAKVNSQGCLPSIGSTGTPSMTSASPFTISAMNVVNNQFGMLFYGFEPSEQPFQGGTLCAQTPVRRTFVLNSGGNPGPADCSGVYSFDMNSWIQSGADTDLIAGTRVVAQFWSRDPQSVTPTGLTNAIDFVIQP